MSTRAEITAPPGAPPNQDGGGGGGGRPPIGPSNVTVTRNMPPKEVIVQPGNKVSYGGHSYVGGEDGNDQFVHGEGAVADALQLAGHVVIVNHNAAEAWNGEEGDATRKRALTHLDAAHKADGTKRTHDHGFVPWDGEGVPADYTSHRQALAQQHLTEDRKMTEPEAEGKPHDPKTAYDTSDPRHPDNKKGGAR